MTAQELAAQIKAQWGGYGDWNAGGVDRSLELAAMLQAQGINSIDGLTSRQKDYQAVNTNYGIGDANSEGGGGGGDQTNYGPAKYDATGTQIRFGDDGKWLGFLGDIDNGGAMGAKASKYLNPENGMVAWSAQGDGNAGYHFGVDPATGKTYIAPSWGSSSDKNDIMKTIGVLAAPFAVGYGLQALGVGAGAGGASGAVSAGTAAELGALNGGATLGGGAAGGAAAGGGVLSAGEFGALTGGAAEGSAAGLAGVDGVLTAAPGGGLYTGGAAAGGGLLSNIPAGLKDALGPAWELIKNNPRIVGALAGGLLGGAGGTDGGETPYTGPMPTITRGQWKPQVTPQYMQQPNYGLLTPQGKPQQNSGLGRYMGLLGG